MDKIIRSILCAVCVMMFACTAVSAKTIKIRFGHDQIETSPHHKAALYLKKLIEEGSNGDIEVTVYPNQLLGSGIQMVEMVQAGAIEMIAVPTSKIQVISPIFQILDLPFLFPSKEELYNEIYGDFGKALFATLKNNNVVGLTYWGMGFKQLTGNFPIHQPSDYKGKKIRVMPSPVIREQFKALGASPVPVDFHELYNALQQGVVDGQENPLVGIATMKLYEVQKYMTLSNHAFLAYGMVINKNLMDRLTADQQKLIKDSAKKSASYQLDLLEKRDQDFLDTIKAGGVEVSELSSEQSAQFQNAMTPVYTWFTKNVKNGRKYLEMIGK
ncbi:TRAP transporter substrate-binding protein [Desulfotalea psychrophila]|uniref:Probable DctP (Periplasmic C4-dicarboxylate binding protein) n=1 Tax=Desulfotalea psychrophila (strain LSv54 / DSM 12343) TaxID=177439 RepID=Q6AP06_DESPS|nr:TRAP transporter substrate-binding protein [Desulfotalea psychrophila]CAG35918.1 probable DctP (periplasmic C4-dicarboxylate binding protein) [Desulfotalea psychrophila LSv54]